MQYRIEKSSNASELATTIEHYLDLGWKLQGGLSVARMKNHNDFIYVQVMVKEKQMSIYTSVVECPKCKTMTGVYICRSFSGSGHYCTTCEGECLCLKKMY